MSDSQSAHIEVVPSGGALGAEIRGLDLFEPLTEASVAKVHQAFLDHCVLVFRDQKIDEADQVRFTSYFGKPVEHLREQPDRPVKEIFIISNVSENGQVIGALGNAEISFHSDLSYLKKPGVYSFLYAIEIPRDGGATSWASGYAAYEALDEELKARLPGLRAVHRHYIESQNRGEPVDHPVVRTHPETGRPALFVGPHLTKSIVGLSPKESDQLLHQLCEHATQPQFVWTHHWQVGDLVAWDNRPTMHRREPFPEDQRRIMKRTQVLGDEIPQE